MNIVTGRARRVGASDDAYWVRSGTDSVPLAIERVHFAGPPISTHISSDGEGVAIRNVTVFAGSLTHWAAIRWGVFGVLRLGVIRRTRLRRVLQIQKSPNRGNSGGAE